MKDKALTHSQAIKETFRNNIGYLFLVFLAAYMIVFLVNYVKVENFKTAAVAAIVPTLLIALVIVILWVVVTLFLNARKQRQPH